jgi:outer membrane protein assembly factor BamB
MRPRRRVAKVPAVGALGLGALALAVGPIRAHIDDASAVLHGPIGSPTVAAMTAATTLAVVALAASTVVVACGGDPISARLRVATAAGLSTVVAAVALCVPLLEVGSIDVHRTDSAVTAQTGDPSSAVTGARRVIWRSAGDVDAVADGRLLMVDRSSLTARDLRTGTELWSTDLRPLSGAPAVRGPAGASLRTDSADGHDVALVRIGSRLSGMDASTGELRWTSAATTQLLGADAGTTVVAVYQQAPVADDAVDHADDDRLVGLDSWTGRQKWSVTLNGRRTSTCGVDGIVRDGHAIYTDCEQAPWSIDLADGVPTRVRGASDRVRAVRDDGSAGALLETGRADPTAEEATAVVPIGADRVMQTVPPSTVVISPAADGRALTVERGGDAIALTDIATSRGVPVALSAADAGGLPVRWTATDTTLAGPARTTAPSADRVVAAVDARSGRLSTVPSPCTGGTPTAAGLVGDRVVVRCGYGGLSTPSRAEIVVLGPAGS